MIRHFIATSFNINQKHHKTGVVKKLNAALKSLACSRTTHYKNLFRDTESSPQSHTQFR